MLKLAFALLLLSSSSLGQDQVVEAPEDQVDQPDPWIVDEDRAPFTVLEYTATEGTWISVDVSPDGERLAFDLLGHLYEMPIEGGDAKRLTHGRSWNMFPRYSPGGERIAFTSDRGGSNDLWVLDPEAAELDNVSEMELPVFQGTWSADGRFLYGTALNMKVRFPAYQFNFQGGRRELIPAGDRAPVNHFQHDVTRNCLIFEHRDERLPGSGTRLKTYDLETGEIRVLVDRPGGAFAPRLSPDGRLLAYVHREDLETVLVVRDLETEEQRIVLRNLDRDRQESGSFYGGYPNLDWHPDGRRVFLFFGGGIHSVDVETGQTTKIPFRAPVKRNIDETIRFEIEEPVSGRVKARSYQWGIETSHGVIFTALGDLHLKGEQGTMPLTRTEAHETSPVFDEEEGWLYYATWNDDDLGAIARRKLQSDREEILTDRQSQYGSLALSNTDRLRFPRPGEDEAAERSLAFLRGGGELIDGERLEAQTHFELCVRSPGGEVLKVTDVTWSGNRYAKRPPTVMFGPEDEWLYFTEYEDDALTLKRIQLDGYGEQKLYTLPHATRAVPSPDLRWLAFREYHRTFVTPYEFAGQPLSVSAADGEGATLRVAGGDFFGWGADGDELHCIIGSDFIVQSIDGIVETRNDPYHYDSFVHEVLDVEYELAVPASTIALTGVRVVTMDPQRSVLEDATVVVKGNVIEAVGPDAEVPEGAKVYDLPGYTIMPGMFDAHGHYGSPISALNVVEQRLFGLHANLAYGVTTMYDVYGTTQKDFLVSDLLRAGKIDGPRIFSVGDPVFVTKYRTKMHRPIQSYEDAVEVVAFNKAHGAQCVKDYSNHRRVARRQLAIACRELGVNLVTESFANPQMNLTQIVDGFTGIEHTMGLTPLYEDVLRLFAHSDIGMDPTLIVVYNGVSGEAWFRQRERVWENEKLLSFFRRDELLRYRRPTHHFEDDYYHPVMADELRKLKAVGVPLMVGAHGQMQGLGAHWEMEMFVHGGFTPAEVLEIATINGFYHHGLDHVLGSIEAGKLADLVILEKNPLEDIRNTRSIELVMKNGVLYSGQDAARVYPDPRPAKPMYFQEKPEGTR